MKRRLIRLGIFLALGVITNVSIAWALAMKPIPQTLENYQTGPYGNFANCDGKRPNCWCITLTRHPGRIWLRMSGCPTCGNWTFQYRLPPNDEFKAMVPTWSPCHSPSELWERVDATRYGHWDEFASGWPFYALRYASIECMRVNDNDSENIGKWLFYSEYLAASGRLNLPPDLAKRLGCETLPAQPIAMGFTVNTLLFALGAWLVFSVPFRIRRAIRIRRNHCVRCNYDLRGTTHDVCPECGQAPMSSTSNAL